MNDRKDQGINASNQDFSQFEQVNKVQQYRLAEAQGAEHFDDDFQISSCDMRLAYSDDASERALFAQQMGRAMEQIGFVILTDHGIDASLYSDTEAHVVFLKPFQKQTDKLTWRKGMARLIKVTSRLSKPPLFTQIWLRAGFFVGVLLI